MIQESILLARQPIYDKQLNVAGYELLFRAPDPAHGEDTDADTQTMAVLVNAFTEIGIGPAADNKPALIRFSRRWLMAPPPFEPTQITIFVSKATHPDEALVAAIRQLRDNGFRIALECASGIQGWDALARLASFIVVDVASLRGETLDKLLAYLKRYDAKLLAQRVENYTVFEHCAKLGFEIFQGEFLCRPQEMKGSTIASNKLVVMNLLAALQNPEIDIKTLEGIITNDVALSVKLLRLCNSAAYTSQAKIDSIKRAIMVMGLQKLKSWVSVIALSRLSDKPVELVMLTLTRAKMMEILAASLQLSPERHFTVGLFSAIDAFFDNDLKTILDTLPFDEEMKAAILRHEGVAGSLLQWTLAQERGDWERIDWDALARLGVETSVFENAYRDALRWSSAVMQSLM